ncbi:MAG: DUF2807 domain-containing protein [Bacteroidales bacterium]|nr:DUF2807 domain-containing protein [Bacteroidales bacterium]
MKSTKFNLASILATMLVFISLTAHAQFFGVTGSGNVVKQERNVGDFSTIKILGSADVIVTQGDRTVVQVQADDNLLENIITKVKGDALIVETEGSIRNYKKFEVLVTLSRLDGIEINGSGDLESEGVIKGNSLSISINGSGDVELELNYNHLEAQVNGSGDIEISGITGDLELDVMGSGDFSASELRLNTCNLSIFGSGDVKLNGSASSVSVDVSASGDVNLYNLSAQDVEVSNNGSGDVIVSVSGKLKARLMGSGDLTYRGTPTGVDVSSLGSGSVYKK